MFAYLIGEHQQGSSVEVINFLRLILGNFPLYYFVYLHLLDTKAPVQTSNFACAEPNAYYSY